MAQTPLYPVTNHPLLSPAAARLDAEQLAAQTVVAERVLGLTGTRLSGDDAVEAANANALQVSYQVALPPETQMVLSERRGSREVTYRGKQGGGIALVNPQAQQIVDALIGTTGQWASFGPRR